MVGLGPMTRNGSDTTCKYRKQVRGHRPRLTHQIKSQPTCKPAGISLWSLSTTDARIALPFISLSTFVGGSVSDFLDASTLDISRPMPLAWKTCCDWTCWCSIVVRIPFLPFNSLFVVILLLLVVVMICSPWLIWAAFDPFKLIGIAELVAVMRAGATPSLVVKLIAIWLPPLWWWWLVMPLVKPFGSPFDTTGVIFSDDDESFDEVEYFVVEIRDSGMVVGLDDSGRCGDEAGDWTLDVITFDIVIADWVWRGKEKKQIISLSWNERMSQTELTGTPAVHGDVAVAALDNELVELYRARPELGNDGSLRDSDETANEKWYFNSCTAQSFEWMSNALPLQWIFSFIFRYCVAYLNLVVMNKRFASYNGSVMMKC